MDRTSKQAKIGREGSALAALRAASTWCSWAEWMVVLESSISALGSLELGCAGNRAIPPFGLPVIKLG